MNPFEHLSSHSKTLFALIQTHGPLTKNDLVKRAQMKLTSINRAIKPLIEVKLVDEVGIAASSGGRKPSMYDVTRLHYYLVGVNLSRTYYQVVITDLKASIIAKHTEEMDEKKTPEIVVASVAKIVASLFVDQGISKEAILGVGLGTVGPLDIEKGKMLNPKKFPSESWQEIDIVHLLESTLKLPVTMENGANTAIYIEQKYGVGKSCGSVAYFNCGIGIRTSVMSDNQMIRHQLNYEDTFAHMVVDMAGEQCTCGKYGCIEAYATLGAIERHYRREVKRGVETSIQKDVELINYMDICQAAKREEYLAVRIIEEAAIVFATGLSNFVSILSPELVILSGPLIRESNLFYQKVVTATNAFHELTQKNKIEYSQLGYFKQDAIAIGAAMYVTKEQ